MSRGGLSKKLVDFSETVVGHMRGGLGHVSIFACMIFGNVLVLLQPLHQQ